MKLPRCSYEGYTAVLLAIAIHIRTVMSRLCSSDYGLTKYHFVIPVFETQNLLSCISISSFSSCS